MTASANNLCSGSESPVGMPRRHWLQRFGGGLGAIALSQLLANEPARAGGILTSLHHAPTAKRVIYLFQSGGPSQMDLLDYKPELNRLTGQELPEEIRRGQRLTSMSGNQASLPLVGSPFAFSQHGQSGMWLSELLPHTAEVADSLCVIKSMHTEAINHGPGVTMMQTGSQFPGRPSMGAWLWSGHGE